MAPAAPALAIAGSVIGAAGSISAGRAQKKAAKRNAARALAQAAEDARRSRRDSDALLGRQRALFAGSGTTSEGSPTLIAQDTAKEADIEVRNIKAGGQARARDLRRAGRAAARAGNIGAVSSLLGGVSDALVIKKQLDT